MYLQYKRTPMDRHPIIVNKMQLTFSFSRQSDDKINKA